MARGEEQRRKENKMGRGTIYKPFAILLSAICILFSFSIFFRVTDFQVTGNSIYTAEDIIAASGIGYGDNLFFVSSSAAAADIIQAMPYISDVKILKSFPSIVKIEITESSGIAAIYSGGEYWIVNSSGKILDETSKSEAEGYILVTGLELLSPGVGQTISADTSGSTALQYVKDILGLIESNELQEIIISLDISNISNAVMNYGDMYTIELGSNEDLEYKFRMLISSLEQLTGYESGTLDLSSGSEAHFTPET